MIKFLRSFFGLNGPASNRTVASTSVSYDLQEVAYIQDSNNRITALHSLYKRFRGTPYEDKMKSVYEKTKKIHGYLISKKRIHELELFHIRNTEHFINTFTLIIDVHQSDVQQQKEDLIQKEKEIIPVTPVRQQEDRAAVPKVEAKSIRSKGELFEIAERVKNRNKSATAVVADLSGTKVPALTIPEISINSIAKVLYLKEDPSGNKITSEISFISTQQEKESFQSYISSRLGLKEIYYVGNARINLPNKKNPLSEEMVPVFYWGNYLYALCLDEYRIFPVKINRNSV